MTDSKKLTNRVREELVGIQDVVEKRMFGGVAFMVNGKMCVTVGPSRIMCRIDPSIQSKLVQTTGCSTVTMKGREIKGYVRVDEKALQKRAELRRWIGLALEFNKRIKTLPRKTA